MIKQILDYFGGAYESIQGVSVTYRGHAIPCCERCAPLTGRRLGHDGQVLVYHRSPSTSFKNFTLSRGCPKIAGWIRLAVSE